MQRGQHSLVMLTIARYKFNYIPIVYKSYLFKNEFSFLDHVRRKLDRLNTTGYSESKLSDAGYRKIDHQVRDLLFNTYKGTGEPDGRNGFQSLGYRTFVITNKNRIS